MRCSSKFFCALTLWECLLAPHHWAINYMTGFCDTWGIYIKGFAGYAEPLAPIVATFKQLESVSNNISLFVADLRPNRARYHTIQLLYPISSGKEDAYPHEREMSIDSAEHRSLSFFENATFRFSLKRSGTTVHSSQWQQISRYAFVHSSTDIYADHPFGRNAIYGELFLDGFDTSLFPWPYYGPLQVELEFQDLDVGAFNAARAMLVIRVYNHPDGRLGA